MNAQVISYMQVLEIENLASVPLMKTVKRKFLKLAKVRHPDGGVGSEADFIELLEAKEYLMNHIRLNKPQEDESAVEETLTRREYQLANIEKINKDSVTIYVPSNHVQAWRDILEEKFGQPTHLPVKLTPAPLQYKTEGGISITSWYK